MTVQERIESRINKNPSGCWLWTGALSYGYGRVFVEGKNKRVHRVMWELTNGSIPKGIFVLHKCDITECANPNHLFLGTQHDNVKDMVNKRRGNLSKTKCKRGHLFNEQNTYFNSYKGMKRRACKECNRLRMIRRRASG